MLFGDRVPKSSLFEFKNSSLLKELLVVLNSSKVLGHQSILNSLVVNIFHPNLRKVRIHSCNITIWALIRV